MSRKRSIVSHNKSSRRAAAAHVAEKLDIRSATQSDLRLLSALYQQLNPSDPPFDLDRASKTLETFSLYPGSSILLGFEGDQLVTSCTLVVVPNLSRDSCPYALIENVVTDARYRKRGYGGVILREATARAWEHGCFKVMLLTGSKDPNTLSFYSNVGFEQNKTGFQIRRIPVEQR